MKRLIVILLFSSLAHGQFIVRRRPPPVVASGPNTFAYVASSVTGCLINSGGGTTGCGPSTTGVYNLHSNPVAGQLMIVWTLFNDTGGTTITPSFSCVNNGAFTAIGSKLVGATPFANISAQAFWKVLTSSGADACRMALSGGGVSFGAWESVQFTYSGSISATDGTPVYSQVTSSGTTATISGVTTTNSNGVNIGICFGSDAVKCSAGSGFTSQNDAAACGTSTTAGDTCDLGTGENINNSTFGLIEYKFNVAAGAISATFTNGSGDKSMLGLVAF